MRIRLYLLCMLFGWACWSNDADAGRIITLSQSPSGTAAAFPAGSVQTLAFTMTNNNNGGDVGGSYYQMRFQLGATGTSFLSSTVAPAGWTRTSFSATSITFKVSSTASAIALGQSVVFNLVMAMGTGSADQVESLSSAQAFDDPTNQRKTNATSLGSWTRKSLAITSFQITDTLGNPITAIVAGTSFQLRMTVKNHSTVTQTTVVSNPNPPTAVKTGTVTQGLTGTAGSPLSLASGASGTIIFTYSTVATDVGTIYFTATARNGATVTTALATSTTLSVGRFIAALAASSSCFYAGSSLTVTMTITNATALTISNVSGTLTPAAGSPVTFVSGPTPATIASMASMTSATVTWDYTGNSSGATNPFTFNGSATGTSGATVTTPMASSSAISRGSFAVAVSPVSTNAGSANTELTFSLTNNGCANVNSVGVTPSAGWLFGNDAYSLVNLSAASSVETWTTSGTSPVTFTAPNAAGQLPLTFSGSYSLVYSATPTSATGSVFTLRVTDANGVFGDIPINVNVNAFKTGTLNNATNKVWREDFK